MCATQAGKVNWSLLMEQSVAEFTSTWWKGQNSMMTLEEMKLAVCEKLPDLITIDADGYCLWRGSYIGKTEDDLSVICDFPISWPTEGLQVCHEAEKLLDDVKARAYAMKLHEITDAGNTFGKAQNYFVLCHATYEQRLEALCRVWFPERF